ncbi:MAG TPA: FtsX-like permease family protein, partial [Bacteroidales bacterium]|nr:FtsX-like permease family protein [Bacteroidales bacterium]
MLAYLYVSHETSYDTFFDYSNRIVRIGYSGSSQSGESQTYAILPQYFLPAQLNSIPEIESHTRLVPLPNLFFTADNKNKIEEKKAFAADSTFFDILNFKILEGNTKTPLSKPNSLVLTQTIAQKFFGPSNAIGKVLEIHYGRHSIPFTVTAVMQDVPSNSHLSFNMLIDSQGYEQLFNKKITGTYTAYEYLLLAKDANIHKIKNELDSIKPDLKNASNYQFRYNLLPITDIHLHSDARAEIKPTSDIRYIYFFFVIAFIILLVSSINYISLFLSHSTGRFKEIGIRKSLGAYNSQLTGQLLLESIFISVLSLSLAFVLAYWALPIFNTLAGESFNYRDLFSINLVWKSVVLATIIGLLTGIYPAWSLTQKQNTSLLSNYSNTDKLNSRFQYTIVVLQFTASIILIISTLVVYKQLSFLDNKDLGFTKDRIITADNSLNGNLSVFRDILSNNPNIKQITASSYVPGTSETGGTGPVKILENGRKVTCNW